MIRLKDEPLLIKGGNRLCYIHPEDDTKILKVLRPEKTAEAKRSKAPLYQKFRPLSSFDDNRWELREFSRLAKKGGHIRRHFPGCFGEVQTDMGCAVCQELIRSDDGRIAPSLQAYLQDQGPTPNILEALAEFFSFLEDNRIIVRDLRSGNLVVKTSESLRIYMIDGIGNSDFIPIANVSKTWAGIKIRRNIAAFRRKLGSFRSL
ncbi:MAG: YrbL family protein [Desulfobacterales bacterium]